MARDAAAVEPRWVRADDLLGNLEANRAPCDVAHQAACAGEVRRLASSIAEIDPKSDRPALFNARLLLVEGNPAAAEKLLAEKCKMLVVQADCDRLRFLAAERLDDPRILEDATASLLAAACSSPVECASTAVWLGRELEAHRAFAAALHMYERAAHESDTPDAWRQVCPGGKSPRTRQRCRPSPKSRFWPKRWPGSRGYAYTGTKAPSRFSHAGDRRRRAVVGVLALELPDCFRARAQQTISLAPPMYRTLSTLLRTFVDLTVLSKSPTDSPTSFASTATCRCRC